MLFLRKLPALLTRVQPTSSKKLLDAEDSAHLFAHALRGKTSGVQRHHALVLNAAVFSVAERAASGGSNQAGSDGSELRNASGEGETSTDRTLFSSLCSTICLNMFSRRRKSLVAASKTVRLLHHPPAHTHLVPSARARRNVPDSAL
jgi:hypothetical protein